MKNLKVFLFLAFTVSSCSLFAQQSSKTKAANKLYEKGGEIEVINAENINSGELEFSPAFYQNGIVFVSSRFKNGERDKKINETFFELFYADLNADGVPMDAKEFSVRINSHLHEGPVSFNREGTRLYFTRNHIRKGVRKANSKGQTVLKIYEARKGTNDWKHVRALPFCNDEYSFAQPSLSADGKKLYFSSNMPGGEGGMDLWVSEFVNNKWSDPINLGPEVNTAKNELFPFIHSSGNLIFASNGREGFGELDLFMINISDRKWGKVTNLGEPFNSPSDDLGLILNPEGTQGYFSSSREGGKGKDDIYQFLAPEGIWGRTKPVSMPISLMINDEKMNQGLKDVEIRVFEKQKDGYRNQLGNQLYESVLSNSESGDQSLVFKKIQNKIQQLGPADILSNRKGEASLTLAGEQEYMLLISKEGYLSQTLTFNAIPGQSKEILSIRLENIPAAESIAMVEEKIVEPEEVSENISVIEAGLEKGAVIVLENIYYDFNKSYIRTGAEEELNELFAIMKKYPSMTIELGSHTDSRGKETYNRRLSIQRAVSAMEYLTTRGISKNRIKAIGYGESELRNQCKDGVECTEEQHQYNRRTEVKVVELAENVVVKYGKNKPKVISKKE